jgi:ribosomal protein S18 acetylase RimI-like enzyme
VTLSLRPAEIADADGPRLLYVSAQPYYDAYAGSRDRALRMLEAVWPKPGHTAAHDLCTLCVLEDAVAGALVAFASEEGDALARRFLTVSLPRVGIWRWPAVARHLRASADVMPAPPARALYVDALAVDESRRRRGVAQALLEDAERIATRRGLRGVALDTGLQNVAAQALYERAGFVAQGERRVADERVERIVGGPGFVSYFKPL